MSRKFLMIIFAAVGLTVVACGDKDDEDSGAEEQEGAEDSGES